MPTRARPAISSRSAAFPTSVCPRSSADPRLYGFHGTLKPPIALADGATERDFLDAVGVFAATERQIDVPALALAELQDFLALVPAERCAALQDLSDRCVIEFDEFRRPADEAELARRRAAGLTPAAGRSAAALGLSLCPRAVALPSDPHRAGDGAARTRRDPRRAAPALHRHSSTVRWRCAISASSGSRRRAGPSRFWRGSGSAEGGG